MTTEILVNVASYETRVAVLEGGRVQEIYLERSQRRERVGDLYKGRVVRVLPGLQAAFVDIGEERNALLHARDVGNPHGTGRNSEGCALPAIERLLVAGQSVLVQVVRDPHGDKGARVTMRIRLPSHYLVYEPGGAGVRVSSRIADPVERERLRHAVEQAASVPTGGYVVRTAAQAAAADALRADSNRLARQWAAIESGVRTAPPASRVHEDLALPLRTIRDLCDRHTERVRVDSSPAHARMHHYAQSFSPALAGRVVRHEGAGPIFNLYDVEDEIRQALGRRVELKSGGYLVFDRTEAMTTVDVNTGAGTVGRSRENTILATNVEAAQAIAHQVRLRNLAGVIVVDFIDMENPAHCEQVLAVLRCARAADHVPGETSGMSRFGLVEMTRRRDRESLEQMLTEPCAVCHGRGRVKTAETLACEIYREAERLAGGAAADGFRVLAPPRVADLLRREPSQNLTAADGRRTRLTSVQGEPGYAPEQFDVVPF